jgi:transposase
LESASRAQVLGPVREQIAAMTIKIKHYDRQIQEPGQVKYPETQALLKVHGVGHITALTFVLTLGSKERFKQSRDVGCYLGLRPRRSRSGDRDPQLGITKAGNVYPRSLLSVPTIYSVHTGRTHRFVSGACVWLHEAASRPETRLSSRWHVSWRFCFIVSGPHKNLTCLSTQKLLEE